MRIASDGVLVDGKPIALRLLGPFEIVHRPSGDSIPVPSARMQALIAYLAAAPHGSETRRRLAGLLWAGKSEDLARQSLRQALSQFRRGADPRVAGLVQGDETTLRLDRSGVVIDRTALFEVPDDADLETLMRAADLYRQDVLAGLDPGAAEFDDWLAAERSRCRDAAIRLLDRLVRALAEAGRHTEALTHANRLAEIDPLREETHRLVIAAAAAASGRASAMARFEQFRLLLKDELDVRPEPATLRLIEALRQQRTTVAAPAETPPPEADARIAAPLPTSLGVTRDRIPRWRRPALATMLATLVLLAALATWSSLAVPAGPPDTSLARASVLLLPFKGSAAADGAPAGAAAYEAEARRAFAGDPRLSIVDWAGDGTVAGAAGFARAHHVDYVVATDRSETADGLRADAALYDGATGSRIFMAPTMMTGAASTFGWTFFQSIYPAILLHRARALALRDPNAVSTLLWEAAVEQARTGARAADPPDFAAFEAVLARNPDNLEALLGLSRGLVERVARDLSKGLNRTDDIGRAGWRLEQAKRLGATSRQPAAMGAIAYLEGMLDKLESRYPEAAENFRSALTYRPGDGIAAAELAHVTMFLGRLEDADALMEAIPHLDFTESAFLAGETALMAGHPDRALFYFDRAVSASPHLPRNYAWRSVALWRLHREPEAHQSALRSQETSVAYLPYWMAARAQYADKRYRDARDRCVEDFEAALAFREPDRG